MTLKRLWSWDDPSVIDLAETPQREERTRKSMIRVPNFVNEKMIGEAKKTVKENRGIKEADNIRLDASASPRNLYVRPPKSSA